MASMFCRMFAICSNPNPIKLKPFNPNKKSPGLTNPVFSIGPGCESARGLKVRMTRAPSGRRARFNPRPLGAMIVTSYMFLAVSSCRNVASDCTVSRTTTVRGNILLLLTRFSESWILLSKLAATSIFLLLRPIRAVAILFFKDIPGLSLSF